MSVKIKKNVIIMTRGDTLNTLLSLQDALGRIYEPVDGDSIRFAAKASYEDENALIEKTIPIDTMTLRLDGQDTSELEEGRTYVYDIKLTKADGTIDTVIPNGTLKITESVE